ncbi:hypothetical protein AXFE_04700 [Acidithrix ferrooxidans]|uniref:Prepilin-type N-terminal cleavage/methylation domain-containing protein n=1 Tax=Acidithrix ferrooxidans TaxID=1280514 RepID=A0A0D8HLK7_9ACTN|nr:hypothetical protein AXFE_04700 [Acidithrix ferrooxidans]
MLSQSETKKRSQWRTKKITTTQKGGVGFDDAGLSLVEILIATFLFGIVSVMTFQIINTFASTQASITNSSKSSATAMTAMNQVTRSIRNAQTPSNQSSPFVSASANSIDFYTYDSATNSDVEMIISANPIAGTSCPCTLTQETINPGSSNTTLVLATHLANDSIFSFGTITSPTSISISSLAISGSATSASTLAQIASVSITLVEAVGTTAQSSTITSTIGVFGYGSNQSIDTTTTTSGSESESTTTTSGSSDN